MTEYTIYIDSDVYQVLQYKSVAIENARCLSWLRAGTIRVVDSDGKVWFNKRGDGGMDE